jgi:hypothetical protein
MPQTVAHLQVCASSAQADQLHALAHHPGSSLQPIKQPRAMQAQLMSSPGQRIPCPLPNPAAMLWRSRCAGQTGSTQTLRQHYHQTPIKQHTCSTMSAPFW